jgi:hypothetical protein
MLLDVLIIGNLVGGNWKSNGWNPQFEAIGDFFFFCLSVGMVEFMVTTKVEMEIHET